MGILVIYHWKVTRVVVTRIYNHQRVHQKYGGVVVVSYGHISMVSNGPEVWMSLTGPEVWMSFTVLYCGIRVREKVSLDSMSYQVILYHHKVTGVEGLNCPIISMGFELQLKSSCTSST